MKVIPYLIFLQAQHDWRSRRTIRTKWIAFELEQEYLAASAFRFLPADIEENVVLSLYKQLCETDASDTALPQMQQSLFNVKEQTTAQEAYDKEVVRCR